MVHDNPDQVQLTSQPDDPQPATLESTTASQFCIALPTETICHIFRLLDPQDLIRLQAVSKLFHTIICDITFWRSLYATAHVPLPPGPFAWQSIHFLQRALVYSTRLEHSWTSEPLAEISTHVHKGPRTVEKDRFRWVSGRWLITSKGMSKLESRDVETGAERVLWDHGSYSNWAATSLMTPQAHYIYVVVHLGRGHPDDPVKLLEFVVDDDTGVLSGQESIDVPTWSLQREAFVPRIRLDSGNAPYVSVSLSSMNKPRHSLLFDPRNRQFYKFPRFRTRLDLLLNYRGAWLPHLVEVYYTPKYLFVLNRSYLIHGNIGEVEVLQIFTLPEIEPDRNPSPGSTDDTGQSVDPGQNNAPVDGRPVVHELRLTHEMLTRDTRSLWLVPIYDTTDPVTQTTTLRFIHTHAPFHRTPDTRVRLVCSEYVLPRPEPPSAAKNDDNPHANPNTVVRSAEPVLPITVHSYDVCSMPGMWRGNLVDVSYHGFLRGICGVSWHTGGYGTPTGMAHKFSLDATGEKCVGTVGDACAPWVGLDPSRHYEYTMDAARGKIWNIKWDVLENDSTGQPIDRDVLAFVTDFR